MLFFSKKKKETVPEKSYDREKLAPVVRSSICTGEKVAGFQDRRTGAFTEIMLVRSSRDLESFRSEYGITEEIREIY